MLRQFVSWLEDGEKTPADLLDLCLKRIAALDPEVWAWVRVAPQPATAAGPLSGIPFGAKDIFDTTDLPTGFGSPLFTGRQPRQDAALVRELRFRGAVLMGKTHTTAFASFDPAPTRNPRMPGHTPGGSSSGSAAAVAAGMVPFAIGSQTLGSVLRPASYCGICGFKPTFGRISTEGMLAFAPSLDTVGFFTQSANDMACLWERSFGSVPRCSEFTPAGDASLLPGGWDELTAAAFLINEYEGARSLCALLEQHGDAIGTKLAALLRRGLSIADSDYDAARRHVDFMRSQMEHVFRDYPVLITPAAAGPAPPGLDSTGDPSPNAPWTALGVPAISVPQSIEGPPVGAQLVAAWDHDGALVAFAAAWESAGGRMNQI